VSCKLQAKSFQLTTYNPQQNKKWEYKNIYW
jgi:hypothetical protein